SQKERKTDQDVTPTVQPAKPQQCVKPFALLNEVAVDKRKAFVGNHVLEYDEIGFDTVADADLPYFRPRQSLQRPPGLWIIRFDTAEKPAHRRRTAQRRSEQAGVQSECGYHPDQSLIRLL